MAGPSEAIAAAAGLTNADLRALHATACAAASRGGEILMRHYGNLSNIRSKGRAGDLVTEADEAAEAAVVELLRQRTPDVGILAEESGRLGDGLGLQWVVDPLDGTTNFAHGFPFFATSVVLHLLGVQITSARGGLQGHLRRSEADSGSHAPQFRCSERGAIQRGDPLQFSRNLWVKRGIGRQYTSTEEIEGLA